MENDDDNEKGNSEYLKKINKQKSSGGAKTQVPEPILPCHTWLLMAQMPLGSEALTKKKTGFALPLEKSLLHFPENELGQVLQEPYGNVALSSILRPIQALSILFFSC